MAAGACSLSTPSWLGALIRSICPCSSRRPLTVLLLVYILIDWANDFLILTNTRVIHDDQQLFVRHVQQQLLVNDIQQVNLRQGSYPEWWFNYGTILIRSFSPRRLTFEKAANPKVMQDKIMGEVNKIRKLSEPERYGR